MLDIPKFLKENHIKPSDIGGDESNIKRSAWYKQPKTRKAIKERIKTILFFLRKRQQDLVAKQESDKALITELEKML